MGNAPSMSDTGFMARALALADAGWGRVHPNPLVGAVVVRDGAIVGEGAHREWGGTHAEVEALRAAGEAARGATLFVTLEPCAHHGKTPPCTDAILAAGVRTVVFAAEDPDPAAAGGRGILEEAGVEVRAGVERAAARRQNALFLVPLEERRPFVAIKFGLSLDSRIARVSGERTRITGPEAEAEVHRLRAGFDAILVGGRTARIDDPLLTARGEPVPRVPPVRVVVSGAADLPPGGRLASTAHETPVWLVAGADAPPDRVAALEARGVRVLRASRARDGAEEGGPDGAPNGPAEGVLDPAAVVRVLAEHGIQTLLCEGGGRLASALLAARTVDRLYLFHAPLVLGAGGVPAFPGPGAPFEGRVVDAKRLGDDTLMIVDRST
jgi:diaminohydroxyphosphoribosylaminopyrimidine deaminase / 5-amino-6-(5-phosphoribosylamino)uracil reductase